MNDYTINERGDVGSLARVEGLIALSRVWPNRAFTVIASEEVILCTRDIYRLALEKLDKVRLQAARTLESAKLDIGFRYATPSPPLTPN